MVMQQKMPSPDGQGQIWAAPERDIAHAFPGYIVRTMAIIKEQEFPNIGADEREILGEYAAALQKFMEGTIGAEDLRTLIVESGLLPPSEQRGKHNTALYAERVFSKWFWRVALGAYFAGVRDAHHPGEERIPVPDLDTAWLPWWKRLFRKLLRRKKS